MDIAIETDSADLINKLRRLQTAGELLVTERRGIDGTALITIIVTITPPIIAALSSIIRAEIEAKKHVQVKHKGMTIQGVSEKALIAILQNEQKRQRD